MKWNSYGKYFHVTNLLIYTVFLMFVTIYASQLMNCVDRSPLSNRPLSNETKEVIHFFVENFRTRARLIRISLAVCEFTTTKCFVALA